jgi:hypothetical protein
MCVLEVRSGRRHRWRTVCAVPLAYGGRQRRPSISRRPSSRHSGSDSVGQPKVLLMAVLLLDRALAQAHGLTRLRRSAGVHSALSRPIACIRTAHSDSGFRLESGARAVVGSAGEGLARGGERIERARFGQRRVGRSEERPFVKAVIDHVIAHFSAPIASLRTNRRLRIRLRTAQREHKQKHTRKRARHSATSS